MAEKIELTLDQMFGFKVIDRDGRAEFSFSDAAGREVTITCKHNALPSLISQLNQLYQEAYAKVKQAPLN